MYSQASFSHWWHSVDRFLAHVSRVGPATAGGFGLGVEVTAVFDEENYVGTGVFLVASVLEQFLGQYTSINSFTQLVAKTKQSEGYLKKWPPRAGELPLL